MTEQQKLALAGLLGENKTQSVAGCYTATKSDIAIINGKNPVDVSKLDLLESAIFDVEEEHPDPEPILTMNDIPTMTLNNISCIIGQAKSRKSFLVSSITGAFMNEDGFLGFNPTKNTGMVLYCDTEQSDGHLKRVVNRIFRIAGLPEGKRSNRIVILALREFAPKERMELIDTAINSYKPTLVVIDGISDLFENGVNDDRESTTIFNYLMKASSVNKCHIMTVLHTNPNSTRARGHAGSETLRKAETVLLVTKDGDTSSVESICSRDNDIKKFAFFITNEGLPMQTEVQEKKPTSNKVVVGFEKILPAQTSKSYTELVNSVMEVFGIKDNAAKKKISKAITDGIIQKNSVGYYHLPVKEADQSDLPF